MTSPVDYLIAHGRSGVDVPAAERAAAQAVFADFLLRCERVWPGLDIARDDYAVYVGSRLAADCPLDEALGRLRAEELYVAFACAHGHPRALEALQGRYGRHIDAVLAGFGADSSAREDLRQQVLDHLFVSAPGQLPFIASYAGQGSLTAWLRVVTKRVALNVSRKKDPLRQSGADEDVMALPGALRDPELDYMKAAYRTAFRESFAVAAQMLSPRQRTLLKQSIVRSLNVRQIARMYKVHHATAARWIAAAREELIANTRAELGRRLSISPSELQSVIGLIQSRLDVTVSRLLREP